MVNVPAIVSVGQRILNDVMIDACVIGDRTMIRDSSGGKTVAWVDRDDPTPCWFTQMSDDLPVVAATSETFGAPVAMAIFPIDTVITEGCRLTNARDTSKWIVTRNVTPPSAVAVGVRVGIRRAEQGEVD